MAPHILDAQIPEVNPTGVPGGDFEQIRSSPEAFGGFGAQAEEKFGAGLEKAGNTGVDLATEYQSHINDIHAAQLQTGYARESTDLFTTYDGLQGAAKMSALPQFKEDLGKLRDKWLGAAPSIQEKTRLAPALSGLEDRYYYYATQGASHAQTQYAHEVAVDKQNMHGGQALLSWSQNDPQGFYNEVANAAQETRNAKEAAGFDEDAIETEAKKTRGVYVTQAIKMSVAQGDPHGVAEELAEKYKGLVDPTSMVQINGILNQHRDQKVGDTIAQRAISRAGSNVDGAVNQAAAATGLSPALLSRVMSIESGGRAGPEADTGSYKGLFQLSQAEFQKYGGGDIHNANDNAMAAAKKLKAEATEFQAANGRAPTGADLYLIHQQGAAGYAAHLANPDAPAWQNMLSTGEGKQKGEAWAKAAIWGNIPDQNKAQFGSVDNVTSRSFVNLWSAKVGAQGAVNTGPSNLKSSAYQVAMSDPDWDRASPEARQRATTVINQSYTSAQIAADQDVKAKKDANDKSADTFVTRMLKGDTKNLVDDIANDPNLTWETRRSLGEAAQKHSGDDVEGAAATYGKGFWGAYKGIAADDGDDAKINDVGALLSRAGPGGDLTLAGVDKLMAEMRARKSPDKEAESEMKKQFLTNARGQITGSNEGLHIKDPKGDELYLKFMAHALPAFDEGRSKGKTAAQLLNPDSPDYIGKGISTFVRPMAQWFNDSIQDNPATPATPAPAATFDVKSLHDLPSTVTAYKSGKITKAQAEQIAIDNGWAARRAPSTAPTVPLSR